VAPTDRDTVAVVDSVDVEEGVGEGVPETLRGGVAVGVGETVRVGVCVGVGDPESLTVGVALGLAPGVREAVGEGDRVVVVGRM
jgi:hypothetical protein